MIFLASLPSSSASLQAVPPIVSPSPGNIARFAGRLIVLMLAGFLLLAHGCHGDEDNELFARAATHSLPLKK